MSLRWPCQTAPLARSASPGGGVLYQALDLVWLDGDDWRARPWSERKEQLRNLLARLPKAAGKVVVYVEPLEGDGAEIYGAACQLKLEGIVSKRLDAPNRSGRSDSWQKTKCARSETFAVIGFTEDGRRRIDGLHVARAQAGELAYAGQVEHGVPADMIRLDRRVSQAQDEMGDAAGAVEVDFPNATPGGRLRHPKYKGIRDDLMATKPRRKR